MADDPPHQDLRQLLASVPEWLPAAGDPDRRRIGGELRRLEAFLDEPVFSSLEPDLAGQLLG